MFHHIGVTKSGVKGPSFSNWNATNDKNVKHSLLLLQFQFLLAFLRTTGHAFNSIINNNINVDDHRARVLSILIFANQFVYITREKSRVFDLKVATSGPHLTFLWTLPNGWVSGSPALGWWT